MATATDVNRVEYTISTFNAHKFYGILAWLFWTISAICSFSHAQIKYNGAEH